MGFNSGFKGLNYYVKLDEKTTAYLKDSKKK